MLSSYSPENPVDSVAIDPIKRSVSYNHIKTGIIENIYMLYLFLAHISLDLDDDNYVYLKLEHHSRFVFLLKIHKLHPCLGSTMGKPHIETYSHVHWNQMEGTIKACDIFEMLILILHFSTLMMITTCSHGV